MVSMTLAYYGVAAGLAALVFAAYLFTSVLKEDAGNARMKEISQAIYEGAMAFLNRQYQTLIPFAIIVFIILFIFTGWEKAVSFLVGAICSAVAGYVGMTSTTKANARTTQAARTSLNKALNVAFKAGGVMGMSVAGLGLLGVSLLYLIFQDPHVIDSFAFGASAIAFFARIGGGIFTKAADVGADLVGKVEAGIPEDDPRNPAVIADNVGDNVGDTAGMGADLFESYGATAMAAMLLGISLTSIKGFENIDKLSGVIFPLVLGAVGILASIISFFFVKTSEQGNPQAALNRGLWGTNILTAIGAYFLCNFFFADKALDIFYAVMAGLVVNIAIGYLTEYYTANTKKPVRHIAESAKTGAATTIITGIAVGMESTFAPILVFCAAILFAFHFAGVYGIAVAAMGMLSTAAIIVAIDSFGPVADNAGGIAEMAELGPEIRERTDRLDSVGNTTAAIAKGFSIGSAALTAMALFAAYMQLAKTNLTLATALNGDFSVNITDPQVMVLDSVGGNLGVMNTGDAIRRAREQEMDLVEINPKVSPVVVKIMDFGSFRYQQEKTDRIKKAHQHVVKMKCTRLSLRIGRHDMEIRRDQTLKFLEEGNKVKIEMMLRGRENQQVPMAMEIVRKFVGEIGGITPLRTEQAVEKQGNVVSAIITKA